MVSPFVGYYKIALKNPTRNHLDKTARAASGIAMNCHDAKTSELGYKVNLAIRENFANDKLTLPDLATELYTLVNAINPLANENPNI
jgi:hypothetical protein